MLEDTENKDKEFQNDNSLSENEFEETRQTPEEDSFKEKFFRISADLQNFKKRVEKERGEWVQHAQGQLLEGLLPIFDELDRAIELSEKNNPDQAPAWLSGFTLIQKNWKKKLVDLGVEEINATIAFNPEFHEALMQVENSDKKSGEIVHILSKGYSFKGKVIKPAQVSVAK